MIAKVVRLFTDTTISVCENTGNVNEKVELAESPRYMILLEVELTVAYAVGDGITKGDKARNAANTIAVNYFFISFSFSDKLHLKNIKN